MLIFDPGSDLFFAEWCDEHFWAEQDLEEIECFLVRDFNGFKGQPPYSGVQLSTTDIILCWILD